MGMTLRVTPERLKAEAASFSELLANIKSGYQDLEQLTMQFPTVWEGEAFDFNREQMNSVMQDAATILKAFDERPKRLLTMAGLYESAEMENAKLSGNLDADVIS